MQMQTLITASSPVLAVFQEAANNSGCTVNRLGDELYLSSWRWSDIESHVETDLTIEPVSVGIELSEEGEEIETPFDLANTQPQEMTSDYLRSMKRNDDSGLFFPPIVEPDPEPRYKRLMTTSEFCRDLLGLTKWIQIETVAQSNPSIAAWRDIVLSGNISVDHEDYVPGLLLGKSEGVFNDDEVETYKKGLLIV